MISRLRQWTIWLPAAGALPIMLTLGLGAAASAQPVLASHVTSGPQDASPHGYYNVSAPFGSLDAASMPSELSSVTALTATSSTYIPSIRHPTCETCGQ
jgi:hypothetical protein